MTATETLTYGRMTYRVERVDGRIFLHGVRGAVYMLMRYVNTPELFFAVKPSRNPMSTPFARASFRVTDGAVVVA